MPYPAIVFEDRKLQRKANWHVKHFARLEALERQQTPQARIALLKQRGFDKQYRGSKNNTFFPTEDGWNKFLGFIELISKAQPYSTKATFSDVINAYSIAFSDMLSAGRLPENYDDFVEYLPPQFIDSLEGFGMLFHKLEGITFEEDVFLRVGQTWIGKFGGLSFDELPKGDRYGNEKNLQALKQVFEDKTPVISGGRVYATSKRASREDSFRSELGLGVLVVLLNMTYKNVFSKLSILRRIERPEQGISKHVSFGLAGREGSAEHHLTMSMRYTDQPFEIDASKVSYWHESLCLSELNGIIGMQSELQTELHAKLLKAILYFRQATLQAIPEMQMSTLWVCVESLLTVGGEQVLESNIPTLLAISEWLLPRDLWPDNVENLEQLEMTFKSYYGSRSQTSHHGSIGHVSRLEVQQFSIVVCNLIVAITHLSMTGFSTKRDMLQASKEFLKRI